MASVTLPINDPGRRSRFFRNADPGTRVFAIAYLILLPVFLAPLFMTPFLPGLDMPFHLSMADMLAKNGRAGSPYGPFYSGTPGLAPYAAHYLALLLFSKFMPLAAAHKVVIGMYVAGMPASAAALLRACRRSPIPALLAFPMAYNLTLHYGFVSFALSIPVVLWMLALLTRFLTQPAFSARLWGGTAAVAVLAFLCHLQNFLYALCAALAFVAFSGAPFRRRLQSLTALLPCLLSLAWWQVRARFEGDPLQQKKTFAFAWDAIKAARLSDMEGGRRTVLADIRLRIADLDGHVLRGFSDNVDVKACQVLFVVIVGYIFLGLVAAVLPAPAQGRPQMRIAGWVAFLGALLAYFGLPHHLTAFELMTFSPRFAVLAAATVLLVVPGSLARLTLPMQIVLVLPALAFGGLYGRTLIVHYKLYGKEIADFASVLAKTPPGGKALGLVFDRQSRVMRIESALVGLPNLYPAVRVAPTSMVPLAYCGMRHIPCRQAVPLVAMPDPGHWNPGLFRPGEALKFFDYFFVRSPPPRGIFGPFASRFALIAHEGSWTVYRGLPPAPSAVPAKPAAVVPAAAVPAAAVPAAVVPPGASPTPGRAVPPKRASAATGANKN